MHLKTDRQKVIDMLRRELTKLDMALDVVHPEVPDEKEISGLLSTISMLHEQLQNGEVEEPLLLYSRTKDEYRCSIHNEPRLGCTVCETVRGYVK